jgi:hypothetical protein
MPDETTHSEWEGPFDAMAALIEAEQIDRALFDFDPRHECRWITPGKCLFCDGPIANALHPAMQWAGLLIAKPENLITVYPLHTTCTQGNTREALERRFIDTLTAKQVIGGAGPKMDYDSASQMVFPEGQRSGEIKELDIQFAPEAEAQIKALIAEHPKAEDEFKGFFAALRQAHQGVQTGRYKSFDDAMEAITGNRPERLDPDDDDDD